MLCLLIVSCTILKVSPSENVKFFKIPQQNPPEKYIDIYTNHHNLKEVLKSYNNIRTKTNEKYSQIVQPYVSNSNERKDNFYNKHEDKLESEYGVFVEEPQEAQSEENFVYLQGQNYHSPMERRPRFKTQKKNWTNSNEKFPTRFSYVQKIPTYQSNYTPTSSSPKERINSLMKHYLRKLYEEKLYQHKNYRPSVNNNSNNYDYSNSNFDDDPNSKSKFLFEESLWAIKNKTVKFANKFLSLFQIIQFENSQCSATSASSSYEGTCYHESECQRMNGTALGNCANGYGVCCVFKFTCGGSSSQNCTYFESPGYPNYIPEDGMTPTLPPPITMNPSQVPDPRLRYNQWGRQNEGTASSLSCFFSVFKQSNDIQQMRIDFIDLELTSPVNGSCTDERLVISGQNLNDQIPIICGYNTGSHVYVDVSTLTGPLQLAVLANSVQRKRYKIRICQIARTCTSNMNCLQYYTGVTGVISSFNYDQAAMFNRSRPGYFNNLNYAICIRKEAGYCSITYTNDPNGVEYPFQLRNVDESGSKTKPIKSDGQSTVPPQQAGADVFNCPDDYIVLNGLRLCGEKLNDGSLIDDFTINAPVTDSSAGPIVVPVRTDGSVTGRGFKLFYTQNRCMAT